MIDGLKLLEAISEIASEKKISKKVILEGIREGFQKAYERFFDTEAIINVEIDDVTGMIKMFQELTVVKTVEDDFIEISEDDAKKEFGIDKPELGSIVKRNHEFDTEFSRLAVYQVRQIIQQKIRGAERENVYEKFISKQGEILSGKITGINEQKTSYLIDIDGTQASIWNKKIIPGEKFEVNQYVSFYVEEVSREAKFSQIMVSRTAPAFLARLLEEHVPEINEGLVAIKGVAREPGNRAKVAVKAIDQDIDPIGAVVGTGGARINAITKELKGEKIDVIKYDEDMATFIMNAMAPVRVISVSVDEENNECDVIVPNEQVSLAIGKSGVASRLVANIVKMHVNVYSYANAQIDDLKILWNGNIKEAELTDPKFLENINRRKTKTFQPKVHHPKRNREDDIDFAALEEFQKEILEAQEQEEILEAEQQTFTPIIEEVKEVIIEKTDEINLDEINANLEALDNFVDDELIEDDEEISDEYDEYYEA